MSHMVNINTGPLGPVLPLVLPPALAFWAGRRRFAAFEITAKGEVPPPALRSGPMPPPPGEKANKRPVGTNGFWISTTNLEAWSTYEAAAAYATAQNMSRGGNWFGVGRVFVEGEGDWFLDIDGAIDEAGGESPLLQYLKCILPGAAYEVSQSGKGAHFFGTGWIAPHACRNTANGLEFYTGGRFAALSGRPVAGDASVRPAGLDLVVAEYFAATPSPPVVTGQQPAGWTTTARHDYAGPPDTPEGDDEIILAWQGLKQSVGAAFSDKAPPRALLEDPECASRYFGGDESGADLAFANLALYLTGANCDRTARLWLRSVRGERDKAQDRPEYIRRTILKALKGFGPDRRVWRQHGAITAATQAGAVIPLIEVKPGEFHLTVDRAEEALARSGLPIYWRGNRIVKTVAANRPSTDGRRVEVPRIADIQTVHLRELMNQCAAFTKSGGTPMDCPKELAEALAARPESRLPPLKAIITAPLMRPDGSLLDVPGYDQHTGLLFDPMGESFPPVPHAPTRDDARAAVAFVKAPFRAFPFKAPADLSVVLSAILTAIQRPVLSAAPLHAINATVAGSGKGLIVETVTTIATGRPPAVMFVPKKDDEFEKSLVGEIVGGSPVIVLDNVEEPVGVPLLCSYLTESIVSVRPLGTSTKRELPTTAMVLATGNNIAVKGDMDRRVVIATIDPACECPEARQFDFDPVEMVTVNRGAYVAAALTVLRAFHVAGRPQQRHPLGSFGDWSRTIRDALIWAGEADPMDTVSEVKANNPARQALGAVIEAWAATLGDQVVTARQVADSTRWHPAAPDTPSLRDALLLVAADHHGEIDPMKLGRWLGRVKGQVVGGRKIISVQARANTLAWCLVNA
jgi:hypothetical protein